MNGARLFAILGAVFGSVGIVLVGVAIAVTVSTASFLADATRTNGTVTGLDARTSTQRDSDGFRRTSTAWFPTVQFTDATGRRHTFESGSGSRPPAYDIGDRVTVVYDRTDPSNARIDDFGSTYLLPLILGGLGAVFTSVGVPVFVIGRRRLRLRSWLRRNGHEIWADVAHVGRVFNVRINGRHPFIVHATWRDPQTGRTHTATSDYLTHDPGPGLPPQARVRVLFDPANPDRNILDLDSPPIRPRG